MLSKFFGICCCCHNLIYFYNKVSLTQRNTTCNRNHQLYNLVISVRKQTLNGAYSISDIKLLSLFLRSLQWYLTHFQCFSSFICFTIFLPLLLKYWQHSKTAFCISSEMATMLLLFSNTSSFSPFTTLIVARHCVIIIYLALLETVSLLYCY